MRLRRFVAGVASCLLAVARAGGAEGTSSQVVEVAEGVLAVLQPAERRFDDSNTVVVTLGDALLVVDAQATLEATRSTIAAIREHSALPVRWLVLTHWHGDHVQGASAYREAWPEVEVVGHASLLEDIPRRAERALDEDAETLATAITDAEACLARGVDRQGSALGEEGRATLASQIEAARGRLAGMRSVPRPFAVPDLTYEDERTIGLGGRTVHLHHRVGHTRGDTVVWIPDVGVLATGDLLDDLPFGGHGYPGSWVAALRGLEELPVEVIVPGHGAVRHGGEHLALVRAMFESIVEQVAVAVAAGTALEEAQARIDLDGFRRALVGDDAVAARAWEAFIPATVERAWLEARGELPD
jgi:glyoxylase-like metal-dependent hydrolase (beta-lactamase superfamily II)